MTRSTLCFASAFFLRTEPCGLEHESDFLDHLCSPKRSVQSLHRRDGLEGHDSLLLGNSPLLRESTPMEDAAVNSSSCREKQDLLFVPEVHLKAARSD
ncbi:hypothetical protein Q5P01_005850 [Channa striata]|uniref:Uncharacterized protein n=1 Tax=Channa striata TaxID=64152 RepID=A0AA88NQ17_CHASR|nr:hypothetical protein Q5P01_005850 [Channa striata]